MKVVYRLLERLLRVRIIWNSPDCGLNFKLSSLATTCHIEAEKWVWSVHHFSHSAGAPITKVGIVRHPLLSMVLGLRKLRKFAYECQRISFHFSEYCSF